MAEGAVISDIPVNEPVVGRSLWADARARLLRNKASVASMIILGLIALACIFGPFFTGHPFDRVYPDYVRTPASLTAYPKPDQIVPQVERIGSRVRATPENIEIKDDVVRMTLVGTGQRPVDERMLAYFERSDLFGTAQVVERQDEGRRLVVDVPIEKKYFFFGTEANGRDLLTRTMKAGQVSLAIGLLATLVAIVIGVVYGATSGYLGGRVDLVMMRIVDILYSLPFIFFVIMLVVFFGRNFVLVFLAVGAVEWLDMARIVRGQTLSIKRQEYVQAAEALGVETKGIIRRHVIPNTLGPVVVYMTLMVPRVILLESFLSFLGLGVQEPYTSLGVLISEGAKSIQDSTWMLVYPALTLVAILFCLNFIGDGLRDALDPKDR
ncbi:ABC transporter permease subunit [Microvirga arsenatis]|uniref:Oligopeptide transport system permease protein OppC n=1 Tax=Microvirga arsenatis TaxID=2692265 RepID=A0ABW9YV46_9HYPH|nr:ABC transporter permease subunit [Microvirga arsenatis]NBJ10823.1 ABC transporter permease subunit [Microvirga arsenatis]NBJ24279.1 ABC transporter permease subunit [Microvirga arsenatis]